MVKHQGSIVSSAQAVTATAVSTDSIDLLKARDIGQGTATHANVVAITSVTAAGAATVTIDVIVADDAALTSNVVVLCSSRAYTKTELTVVGGTGTQRTQPISVLLPPNLHSLGKRYLGVRYTIATGPLTAGTFNAWFGPNHFGDALKFYPAGY
jgi:hypothetical protein